MHHMTVAALALAVLAAGAAAQEAQPADSTGAPAAGAPPAAPPPRSSLKDRIYYGGSVVLSFGNTTRIGVYPMIAYKLRPKLSVGAEVGYEYVNYDDFDASSHNYGGSVFGRYRLVPQLYGHAEFQAVNYEIPDLFGGSSRETVPFLLLGGGYVRPLNARTSAYVEVLVDLLQDEDSPYDDWEPILNVGVGVGF
jgi:hypothetical protein